MSDDYTGHLLEQIVDQNKAVLEAVGAMRDELTRVPKREEFDELKQDVKTIKAAVAATNRDVAEVKREVQVSELKLHDMWRDLDEHVHLPAHGKEMLKQ